MNVHEECKSHYEEHGDSVLFKKLTGSDYDVQRGNLTKYAYGRLNNWQDAEDAVQDAYIHLLSYPPKGEGHNFGGLFKLALDRAIGLIRSVEHRKGGVIKEVKADENPVEEAESEDPKPDDIASIVGLTSLVMDMSDALKPKQKAIVRWSMIFNYSYADIVSFTNTDYHTVCNTIVRFRAKIKGSKEYAKLL